MTQAYPLAWPPGWPRTPEHQQCRSVFRVTPEKARRNLLDQLRLLGATPGRVVISTNVALRLDGQPYADASRRIIRDPGVAVYFDLAGKPFSMARDLYQTPHENMHALGHAIEHMRGLERHGGAHMVERAFSGFTALPPPMTTPVRRDWWTVLGLTRSASIDEIKAAYRKLAAKAHPDQPGGSHDAMAELSLARDAGLNERSLAP